MAWKSYARHCVNCGQVGPRIIVAGGWSHKRCLTDVQKAIHKEALAADTQRAETGRQVKHHASGDPFVAREILKRHASFPRVKWSEAEAAIAEALVLSPALAIEAQRAKTAKTGSVEDESAGPKDNAQRKS